MDKKLDLEWLRRSTAATINRAQAAEVLDVDPRTVTEGIANGTIPGLKIGRRVVVPRERLLAILTSDSLREVV